MSNYEKPDRSPRKYFTPGDGEDELALLFQSIKGLKNFHSALETLLREDFPEEPGAGLYFSSTGTFKDRHP